MRIVFMGTPDIARICLQRVYEAGFTVVGAYTKPDTAKNRGMKLSVSEVKAYCTEQGIPVFQPTTFADDAVCTELEALQPDLILVVAYGKILPQRVLDIPKFGCINMHASILPSLRGAGPVQWSILNHCAETGVSAMFLSAGMDEGDVIEIRKTPIDSTETAEELLDRLAEIAAELACDTIRAIENGTAVRTPQDPSKATYAPMLSKELSPTDFDQPAQYVVDHIRGLIPWPVATATIGGTLLKLYAASVSSHPADAPAGTVLGVDRNGLHIACAEGAVCIGRVQAEGGKQMPAADYFRGHPLKA